VQNFLKDPTKYGNNSAGGNNKKITSRDKRRLLAETSKSGSSSSDLREKLELPITPRHVRRLLADSGHLKWRKMTRTPRLSERHKAARINYATSAMQLGEKWQTVIFSDEKKFNLDGPDGLHSYWRDLRREPHSIMSRNFGGGSLMIWAAISYQGKSDIAFLDGRQNSQAYCATLENYLLPFSKSKHEGGFIFMQDNAAIHKSSLMKRWFEEHQTLLLDHPALSPDLNPIENCWGILARSVYKEGKQYQSIAELKESILGSWNGIELSTIRYLIYSEIIRLRDVLLNRGGVTKYYKPTENENKTLYLRFLEKIHSGLI